MSKITKQTLNVKNQKNLYEYIENGGRIGAHKDFNLILKRAAGGKK